ncbi:MAG: nuclear transport factor 2 family protein [Halobacteriota archaeon]|jgi:ketosteroid isomerase-like protein
MIAGLIIKKMVRENYEALTQNNFAKLVSSYRDDATLIFPGEVAGSGTFKGKAAIEGWFRQWFDQFPSTHFDIKDIYVKSIFGFRTNTVAVHWDIQVTNRYGRAFKNSGVSVYEIKGGKAFRSTDFIFDQGENFKSVWETV